MFHVLDINKATIIKNWKKSPEVTVLSVKNKAYWKLLLRTLKSNKKLFTLKMKKF